MAKILTIRKEAVKHAPRTDIRVHLGSVHGLDEVAEALLVAVHLPVSTNEEFPAHGCSFLEGCLLGIKKRCRRPTRVHFVCGKRADVRVQHRVFIRPKNVTPPLSRFHWFMAVRPQTHLPI